MIQSNLLNYCPGIYFHFNPRGTATCYLNCTIFQEWEFVSNLQEHATATVGMLESNNLPLTVSSSSETANSWSFEKYCTVGKSFCSGSIPVGRFLYLRWLLHFVKMFVLIYLSFSFIVGRDSKVSIKITYKTSPTASAVQWLKPIQTAGKKHPYLFSQCQVSIKLACCMYRSNSY